MEKPNFKKLCKMHIQQLTNFPFIEQDFDFITNYEFLCLVVDHLNKVIENSNIQNDAITQLYNAFVKLKDYVDNLDLQDEVNNKLDEMVEDGTLLNILSNYANLEKIYNTFNELYNDNGVVKGQHIKCFGMLEINDGNGGEFIIDDADGIPLANGLFANPLNNYQENFYNEITFTRERHYDTECYFTTIPLNDNDGKQIDLVVNKRDYSGQSPLKYAQENLTSLTINASLYIVNKDDNTKSNVPCIIGNGQIINDVNMNGETGVADNYLYVGFTEDREIKEFKVNSTTPSQLLASGIINGFDAYYKLIENYFPTDLTNVVTNEDGVVENHNPRQVLCEMQDKTIMILTCDGRTGESKGLTSQEMQELLVEKNVKNAWNLDGGGSTSTEIKTVKINNNIDASYTEDRYIPYTLNVKKTTRNKNIANIYSFMSDIIQLFNYKYQKERIRIHSIQGKDANDLIGELYFGMGNQLQNTPTASGYLINLTNTATSENRYLYNKQIYIDRLTYKIWTRQMNQGVWSNWVIINNPLSRPSIAGNTYTVQTGSTYEQIPFTNVNNFDGNSCILNEDGTISFNDISNKLLYITARVRGSTGAKFLKLQKNDTDVLFVNNYNTDTNNHEITLIGALLINSQSDKFKILVNANQGDIIDQIQCYVK